MAHRPASRDARQLGAARHLRDGRRAGEPHLLYVMRYRAALKYGHGDERRVSAHLRAGREVVRVLRASHEPVVAAELAIKRHARHELPARELARPPVTFAVGTEVLARTERLIVNDYLHGDEVVDVTDQFASSGRQAT